MDIAALANSRSINLKSDHGRFPFSRTDTAEFGSLVWKFDPNNHYLHPKWVNLIYSKRIMRLLIGSGILSFILGASPAVWCAYVCFISVFFWIPFLVLVILSFNRDARGFIMKSSEFWIKIVYAVAYPSLCFIHYHYVLRLEYNDSMTEYLGYATVLAGFVVIPLLMVVVGGMDAIPKMKYKHKAMMMAVDASYFTIWAVVYQFVTPRNKDYTVTIEATGSEVSIVSSLSNVTGMLAIFLWKQAFDVIHNKDRCTSITYRPYLQWVRPGSGSPLIDAQQHQEFGLATQAEAVTVDDTNTFSRIGLESIEESSLSTSH